MWARELKPETILVSGVQKERRSLVYPMLDVPETFLTDQRRERGRYKSKYVEQNMFDSGRT